jgi:hypothetical protein
MYLLNLSLAQFLALFGSISVAMVLLYLLGRPRRKQVVATLRFWTAAEQSTIVHKRKRIQQPLSLLLQLLSMLLLLLAVAQLRLGRPLAAPHDHVLIVDTSAWMSAANGNRTLMDQAREKALAYVNSVPPPDRVMLVRADALATPATAFETNRTKLQQAIAQSTPGATALNLDQALAFAHQEQALASGRPGEIVYVGPGRTLAEARLNSAPLPKNLRILSIADVTDNCGLRKIGARRSAADPEVWDIYASVRNYGSAAKTLTLSLRFGGAPAGAHKFTVPSSSEREIAFAYRTRAAGLLEADLFPHDRFPDDDRAVLELPQLPSFNLTVYSNEPDLLRPIVTAIPRVHAAFQRVEEYRADAAGGLMIIDRVRPPKPPNADAIWIEPPPGAAPIPVRTRIKGTPFDRWCSDDALCAGLRTKDIRLESTDVFESAPGDIKIGEVREGPVIVARAGKNKSVVFGFHPALSDLRYELATPLLFGNILRWMEPELFRRSAAVAGSAGSVTMQLDCDIHPEDVRVLQQDGTPVPFTTHGQKLRFFSGTPGTVRVLAGERETVYSLTLPELWDSKWEVPAGTKRGIPVFRETVSLSRDLWQILAVLGGLGLLLEWFLFGRAEGRIRRLHPGLAILRHPGFRKAS